MNNSKCKCKNVELQIGRSLQSPQCIKFFAYCSQCEKIYFICNTKEDLADKINKSKMIVVLEDEK